MLQHALIFVVDMISILLVPEAYIECEAHIECLRHISKIPFGIYIEGL